MKYVISIVLVILLAGGVGYYYYNKPNDSLEDAIPAFTMTADQLFSAFESDEAGANKKFLDKVVEVKGKVQGVNCEKPAGTSVTLETESGMFGVICKMDSTISEPVNYKTGDEVIIKGMCTGMLMDVVLVRCVPSEKK